MNKYVRITEGEPGNRDEISLELTQQTALRLARNLLGQMDLNYPHLTVRVGFSAHVEVKDDE